MDMEFKKLNASELKRKTIKIRSNILDMIPAGKVGHLGGSSSIADIVTALYMGHMRVFDDPKNPARDRLIFSKGHAVLAQYACLVELGYFDRQELHHVKTLTGLLQGHPDMSIPGIEAVTGSLGQGLSVSLGIALGLKLDHIDSRVFCVLGDGELGEGQVWEAAMAAGAYGADNLCSIIDRNGVQATDAIQKVLPNPELTAKWSSFGWHTIEIDGHDIDQILVALDEAKSTKGKPTAIIANTVKGKCFAFAEGKAKYHNAAMTDEEYREARETLERMGRELA
ncbi:MAG: transketolase [Raoultibacter sp.]